MAGFVLTGVISQDKQDTLSQIMTHAILSIGSVGAVATSAWKYIKSRNDQKIAQINATTPPVVATPPVEPIADIPKPVKKPRKTNKKKPQAKTTKRKRNTNG